MRNRTRFAVGAALAAVFLLSTPFALAQQKSAGDPPERIDINSADAERLMELPGIGPAYAERIIAYREEHGPFRSIEEIMNVKGIGEKAFLRIRDRIRAGKGTR